MTMSMCKIVCITNRLLVSGDFLEQLEKIVSAGVDAVILREKDLSEADYEKLAERAAEMCGKYHVPLILHTFVNAAQKLGIRRIHLPLGMFLNMNLQEKAWFDEIGVSVHSIQEALQAAQMGASYLTAGHVFATDCKKGIAPRGLLFLEEVCHSVDIPVYAIGGIDSKNTKSCMHAGAEGICLMSSLMKTENSKKILETIRENQN